jgi:XTP/dITP diphosphohydrolase
MKLTLATTNAGKVREIVALLEGHPIEIQSLKDLPPMEPIDETGTTFAENALIKAKAVWDKVGGYVLGEDSGLECDDLQGEPGIYSARYSGPNATDESNNALLIKKMRDIHDASRYARYVCSMSLITPEGQVIAIEEYCEGMITFTPKGSGGFGYDPYFYVPQSRATMAELPLDFKNQISHRGKAMAKLVDILQTLE